MSDRIVGNHQSVTGDDKTIIGNHNKLSGTCNHITGNHCTIEGTGHVILGNHNIIHGEGHQITGNHCTIYANNCQIIGNYNKNYGTGNKMTGNYNCGDAAAFAPTPAPKYQAGNVVVGNGAPVQEAFDSFRSFFGSGNFFGSGSSVSINGRQVVVNGRVISDQNASDTKKAAAAVPPAVAPSAPPLDPTKDEVLPDDAPNDAPACRVCLSKRPNVLLAGCRHLHLCATCTIQLLESPEPKCPTCRKEFKKTEATQVFL